MTFVDQMAQLFGEKVSQTKAEAFLRGYLVGLGAALVYGQHPPDFELIAQDPALFIPIEQQKLGIYAKVTEAQIEEAKEALRQIYKATQRPIPQWLQVRTTVK